MRSIIRTASISFNLREQVRQIHSQHSKIDLIAVVQEHFLTKDQVQETIHYTWVSQSYIFKNL